MKTAILSILFIGVIVVECSAQMQIKDALVKRSEVKHEGLGPASYQDATPIPVKSVTLAVVFSALIPGTGELYAGNFETGKYAMMAEAAIWITYAAFYTHGNWVRQDARSFAAERARTNFNSKSDQFDVNIGNYLSIDEYNQAMEANDPAGWLKYFTDNVRRHSPVSDQEGKKDFADYYAWEFKNFQAKFVTKKMVVRGRSASIALVWEAVRRPSGAPEKIDMVGMFELATSGRIESMSLYFDTAKTAKLFTEITAATR